MARRGPTSFWGSYPQHPGKSCVCVWRRSHPRDVGAVCGAGRAGVDGGGVVTPERWPRSSQKTGTEGFCTVRCFTCPAAGAGQRVGQQRAVVRLAHDCRPDRCRTGREKGRGQRWARQPLRLFPTWYECGRRTNPSVSSTLGCSEVTGAQGAGIAEGFGACGGVCVCARSLLRETLWGQLEMLCFIPVPEYKPETNGQIKWKI